MVFELQQHRDLEQLLQRSKTDPVLIFKHSTQCSVSDQAYDEFTRFQENAGDLACGVVLVIENREISNAIAAQLGIPHESPQAILVKDGQPKWNASHWAITTEALAEAVQK
ncbi:MAG: bacillithiol system redox-active protein YtxJ [Acidobacteria bacterium]|nr:MAG: bacillithiol system redox-active protein YtxJ [Acidobacteriota bacterium]